MMWSEQIYKTGQILHNRQSRKISTLGMKVQSSVEKV